MDSREHPDLPHAVSYPSPNATQMAQGTMHYYSNRQLTADELLSAELSRETSGPNLADGANSSIPHGLAASADDPEMDHPHAQAQHQQQHILPFSPGQQVGVDPNHDLSYGDQSARRKRSKISRACDECRRKKVRCDASSESGGESCTNCHRLGLECQFSRVPLKRGPSKGYIKELAERLHTLESQMQPPIVQQEIHYQEMSEVSPPRPYNDFASPMETGSVARKRTYSMFEGLPNSSFTQPSYTARGQHNVYDANDGPTDPENPVLVGNNAPRPGNLFWTSPANEHDLAAGAFDMDDDLKSGAGLEPLSPTAFDGGSLSAYYAIIHPFFPILHHSKDRLIQSLRECSREIQEIFLHSLLAATRTDPEHQAGFFKRLATFSEAQQSVLEHARQATGLRSWTSSVTLLQCLLLMLVDCDFRGPENLLGKSGLPKHTLIQSASKVGYDLLKFWGQLRTKRRLESDMDASSNLARRLWISLGVMARWHAMGVADASLLGSFEIGGSDDDKVSPAMLMQLASYSTFLPVIVNLATIEPNVCQTNTGLGRMVAANLVASLERLADVDRGAKRTNSNNDDDEGSTGALLEHLAPQLYWTLRLLIKRHIFVYSPQEILFCAEEVINEMQKRYHPDVARPSSLFSPFDLHSLALATMTLLEATALPEHAAQCWESLRKVEEILDSREKQLAAPTAEFTAAIFATPGWDARIRSLIDWKRARGQENADLNGGIGGAAPAATGQQLQQQQQQQQQQQPPLGPNEQRSLQHLADLAVGAEGSMENTAAGANMATASDGAAKTVTVLPPSSTAQQQQQQQRDSPAADGQGRVVVDFTMLTAEGYLNVFSGVTFRRGRTGMLV